MTWLINKLGRKRVFNIGISGWIWCVILNGLLFFTVEADKEMARLSFEQTVNSNNRNAKRSHRGVKNSHSRLFMRLKMKQRMGEPRLQPLQSSLILYCTSGIKGLDSLSLKGYVS